MGSFRCAVLFVIALAAVGASRINRGEISLHQVNNQSAHAEGVTLCDLKESEEALGYGIHGLFKVKSCRMECLWSKFLTDILVNKVLLEPKEEDGACKCKYAPRYWEGAGSEKLWFQFRVNQMHKCTVKDCKDVFFTWGNMFLKKAHYPGDNEKMPVQQHLEASQNYDMTCSEGIPEGIVLPSPGSKIIELRLRIAKTDDPEEKARLQKLLDELLGDKAVEVFLYDMDGEWGEEHHADSSAGDDLHTFQLKPCKSNLGNEVTKLSDILDQCGPWEKDVSMLEGKLRYHYKNEKDWGPEQVCNTEHVDAAKCQMLQTEVDRDGWKLLSFRLKPCMTPSGDREETELNQILSDEHCGKPILGESLLPVKVSAAKKFDSTAPEDELEFPCP